MEWPLLSSLAEHERRGVVEAARQRSFARGEVVFHEGDPADSLHLVVSGHLAVRVSTVEGSTATLNLLGGGDTFGELSLLRDQELVARSATIVALDPVLTKALSAQRFHALCQQYPGVERWLVNLLAQRVTELSAQVRDLMFVGLDRRLYGCLLDLAQKYEEGAATAVIPLTQEHLADFVGGTRPSVNQVLQRLSTQGIVEVGRGRVTILDREALLRKAGRREA
ncbi:MAG: Crp/Fnr family transcriptional regulator [Nocardioides sp.]